MRDILARANVLVAFDYDGTLAIDRLIAALARLRTGEERRRARAW